MAQSASGKTPYDNTFDGVKRSFAASTSEPDRAALIVRAKDLRDFVSDLPALDIWVEQSTRSLSRSTNEQEIALARQQAESKTADALEVLGRLQLAAGDGEALHSLDAAARTAATAGRWLAVAQACGNQLCRSAALENAVALAPQDSRVLLSKAEYYIGREQLEKARDLLLQAVRFAPADFVARKRLADLYARAGLMQRAVSEYNALAAEFPRPLWLRRELALAFENADQPARARQLGESAFRDDPGNEPLREMLGRVYDRSHDAVAADRLYRTVLERNSQDGDAAARRAELRLNAGDSHAAEAQLRNAIAQQPDNPQLRQQLAYLLAAGGRRDEADRELKRAGDAESARDLLAWRGLATASADEDAAYLANIEQAKRETRFDRQANAVQLADVRIDRVQMNGLASSHVQQIFRVLTAQGARDFSNRNVQYSPASESLKILVARVHKQDGRILDAADGGETSVADVAVAMYYDVRAKHLRFPAVEPGDVIELEYRTKPEAASNPYGDYYGGLVLFGNTLPTAWKRYVLVTPASRNFTANETRMAKATVSVEGTHRIFSWEAHDLAALPNEPRGPSATEVAPYVSVSTFANWDELGRWYAELVRPQFTLDSTLREVASRVTAENPDELARIRAIHQLVLRSTHYVALEFGVYSYKPYPVSQIYARRFGDCKDKASLMVALMRAVGVDAELALTRTRRMGAFDQRTPSIAPFNHAIVYLPKYGLWLDGTAEYSGARELPLEDQGAMALTVSADGKAEMHNIPVTTPEDNLTRRVLRAELRQDGTIDFTGTALTRGEDAPGLRREYEVQERQRESMRAALAEVFPTVRVDNVTVEGAADLDEDVTVNFRGTLDAFTGRNVVALTGSWMSRKYLETLAPIGQRTQDLVLPAPWTTQEELRVTVPPNIQVELPGNRRLDSQYGSAALSYELRGREVIVNTSVQFRQLRIAPAEYAAFREFCSDVERAFRQEVKVTLR